MICGSCGRRCDPNRSFCTNCGSSVFIDERAGPAFSASPAPRSSSVSATPRALRALQRSATSFDRTAVSTAAKALKASNVPLSFPLGRLVRVTIFAILLWYAASWLLEISEVRSLKDAFQHGELTDQDLRAARDAVFARLDAVLGRTPAQVAQSRPAPAERSPALPVRPSEGSNVRVAPPPVLARVPPGVSLPGNGVTLPRVLRLVKPTYTPEALRARVEGTVVLEVVVRSHGVAGDISVWRSLDRRFGLDQQAIEAVRQWRFAPGERMGQPVPVLVQIEIRFSIP